MRILPADSAESLTSANRGLKRGYVFSGGDTVLSTKANSALVTNTRSVVTTRYADAVGVAVSNGGDRLALWRPSSKKLVVLDKHGRQLGRIPATFPDPPPTTFSSSGRAVFTASLDDHSAVISAWNAVSGMRESEYRDSHFDGLAPLPGDRVLISRSAGEKGGNREVIALNSRLSESKKLADGRVAGVSQDGVAVVRRSDGAYFVMDGNTGNSIADIDLPVESDDNANLESIDFSGDSKVIVAAGKTGARRFEVKSGRGGPAKGTALTATPAEALLGSSVAVSRDGRWSAVAADRAVEIFWTDIVKAKRRIKAPGKIRHVSFADSGALVVSTDSGILVLDPIAGIGLRSDVYSHLGVQRDPRNYMTVLRTVRYDGDRVRSLSSTDGNFNIGEPDATFSPIIAFNAARSRVVLGSGNFGTGGYPSGKAAVRIVGLDGKGARTLNVVAPPGCPRLSQPYAAFSQSGRYVVVAYCGGVASVVDLETGERISRYEPTGPKGARLLDVGIKEVGDQLHVLVLTSHNVTILDGRRGEVRKSQALSPVAAVGAIDGEAMATWSEGDGLLRVYRNAYSADVEAAAMETPVAGVAQVAVSPDGRTAAALVSDYRQADKPSLRVWDVARGRDALISPLDGVYTGPIVSNVEQARTDEWLDAHGYSELTRSRSFDLAGIQVVDQGRAVVFSALGDYAFPARSTRDDVCRLLDANMSRKTWESEIGKSFKYVKGCPDLPIEGD
ncbi:MAG: hypothetical protein QM728_05530 [Gordonia sp. (in: high G+C Gram-positive bacteria)]|uniref:hypothetical protein n=1 Tax=Gordonia sp. (in: high G+C Gram-positive bacteria) TaxID=84139 RepID=UPI0039E43BB6